MALCAHKEEGVGACCPKGNLHLCLTDPSSTVSLQRGDRLAAYRIPVDVDGLTGAKSVEGDGDELGCPACDHASGPRHIVASPLTRLDEE